MALTRIGSDSDSQNATALALTWSVAGGGSAPQSGDFALLSWNGQASVTWTPPSGFTLIEALVADSGTHEGRLYYRVCDGTESGDVTLTHSGINKQTGILRIWRGVHESSPVSDHAVRDESTAGTSHACPQVTTVNADEAIVTVIQERVTDSSTNYTAPTDYDKLDQPTPAGGGGSTSAALADDGLDVSRIAGTNVTPGPWTNGVSTANVLTWTVALRPAVTATPVEGSDTAGLTEAAVVLAADVPAADTAALGETADVEATAAGEDTAALTESAEVVVLGELTWRFAVDWGNDGSFDGPGDDVTERVLAAGGFSSSYGRDQARSLAPPAAGRAAFTLNNQSRDYSPDNADSPLAGDLLPARPVQATVSMDGETHTLFRGHLDDYTVQVERNSWTVDATALDPLAKLRGATISTRLYQGIRTDQAINVILDKVGWPDTPLNTNPLFTDGTSGWSAVNGSIEASTEVLSPQGTQTLKVTPDGTSSFGGADSDLTGPGTVTPGEEYVAFGRIYSPAGWATWRLNILWYDEDGVLLSTSFGETTTVVAGAWQEFETHANAPDGASQAKVSMRHQNTPTSGDVAYLWSVRLRDPSRDDPYRRLDVGATWIRWWWEEDTDAWDAVLRLVQSEGPGATVHADEAGGIVFRSRHHRLLDERSTTGQAVITDGTGGYEPAFSAMSYDHGWSEVVNHVSVEVGERDPAAEPETVWESEDLRSIGAGETLELRVTTTEPVVRATLEFDVAGGGSASGGLLQSSGQTLTVLITAPGSAVAVSNLRVVAQPVAVRRTINVETEDTASAARYGRRTYTPDIPWAGVHDAAAIASLIVGARAERLPVVTVTLKGARVHERLLQQVSRDLSDRVHITETVTGVDTDFYLETISHRVSKGGFLDTEFGLEKAATQVEDVFRFDDDDHGFDDGVFGSEGLDDPETLFIFDQDGHGFDDGVFAT